MTGRIVVTVLLLTNTASAQVSEVNIALWENRLFKSTPETIDQLIFEMGRDLPDDEPWPERAKVLLLNIINKHYIDDKYREICCQPGVEWSFNPAKLAYFQDDLRFLPFLVQQQGNLWAMKGLVRLGEPALPHIVKSLYREDRPFLQIRAAKTMEMLLKKNPPFLKYGDNYQSIKQGLFHISKSRDKYVRGPAIESLKFINDGSSINILQIMAKRDSDFHIRKRAQEALQFVYQRGVLD